MTVFGGVLEDLPDSNYKQQRIPRWLRTGLGELLLSDGTQIFAQGTVVDEEVCTGRDGT